ncbi:MAG TPA: tetratricopeptide repeat protein [Gammaproteobacteria bacterium]|nr:tetratricopeptide repeat protein [Gammaproteobacteria bacterium]HKH21535.1 tetratricopeptide repeat protein [Gammaproteobacteria bacterium]
MTRDLFALQSLSGAWGWILDPANRGLFTWTGGGLVAVMAAGWAFYKHFSRSGEQTPSKTASSGGIVTNHVTATTLEPGHVVVATGNVSIGPQVDVNSIVDKLVKKSELAARTQTRLESLEEENSFLRKQVAESVKTVVNLAAQKRAPPGINETLALLKQGKTKAAEGIFQTIAHRKEGSIAANRKEAAAAYRHLGALAYLNDPQKALDAYRRATQLDPGNADGWNALGILLYRTGNLSEAEEAFRKVLSLGRARNDRLLFAAAYTNLGIVYRVRGDLDQAEAMFHKGLEIDKGLGHQEGMARAYANLGVVYKMHGDADQAEASYRKALELFEQLGAKRKSAQVQRWLDALRRH